MIHSRAPFEGRGAESLVWNITRKFADAGHEISVFCPEPFQAAEVPSIDGISFEFVETTDEITKGQIEFFLRGLVRYKRTYDRIDPDIVYDNPSPALFPPAHLYGDATVVSKVHAIYRRQAFSCKHHWLVKVGTLLGEEMYRFLLDEYHITNSESTAERLRPLVNTDRNSVRANPIGITPEEFMYNFNPDSNLVLSLSKLTPRKGVETLLRAWSDVKSQVPDARLVVAGDGPKRDELEELAHHLHLSDVEFTGFISHQQKIALFEEAKVYTLPTLMEGFGMSNLEAMASGCAVVSTDTWGVRDYLEHRENGLMVPPKDPDALTRAIVELLQDSSLAEAVAVNGRKTAEEYRMDESLDRELNYLEEAFANQ